MLDSVYVKNAQSLKIVLEWMKFKFFFENKFCDIKESSETKYYCIRRKFLKIFLRSPKKRIKSM